jgi:hypothetical protein
MQPVQSMCSCSCGTQAGCTLGAGVVWRIEYSITTLPFLPRRLPLEFVRLGLGGWSVTDSVVPSGTKVVGSHNGPSAFVHWVMLLKPYWKSC